MKKILYIFSALTLCLPIACKKEEQKEDPALAKGLTDESMYASVKDNSGYVYYKNDASIKASSKSTAHGTWFNLLFNSVASAALTDNGKLPVGVSFPEGSIVVKELYETQQGGLKYIAVMQKASKNENQNGGWVWGEFEADGKVYSGIGTKGGGCAGFHSSCDRDKVRAFEFFPKTTRNSKRGNKIPTFRHQIKQ